MTEDSQVAPTNQNANAVRLIAASKLEQMPAFGVRGRHLGCIATLMLDRSSGQVAYVVLSVAELGGSERLVPLPWNKLTYNAANGGCVVELDERAWNNAPSYGAAEMPWTDPPYDRGLSDYYSAPWL